MIAALAFSGIKAKGSEESTEAVQKAETTVMSASELEKYLGYEEGNTVSDSTSASDKKNSTSKKSSSKKSAKKQQQKKSSGTRTVSESAKSNAGAAGQGSTQTPVAAVPANGYKDGVYEGSGNTDPDYGRSIATLAGNLRFSQKDYLNPIPLQQIRLNPNLAQNPGW